jgi:hypothetical protein
MTTDHHPPLRDLDEDAALGSILEGTATKTGGRFFAAPLARSMLYKCATAAAAVNNMFGGN